MDKQLIIEASKYAAMRDAWDERMYTCFCERATRLKTVQIDNLDETREYGTSDFLVVCRDCYKKGIVLGKSYDQL